MIRKLRLLTLKFRVVGYLLRYSASVQEVVSGRALIRGILVITLVNGIITMNMAHFSENLRVELVIDSKRHHSIFFLQDARKC